MSRLLPTVSLPLLGLLGMLLAGCSSWEFKRVPPGQSLNVALAQKAIPLYPLPSPDRSSPRKRSWWDRPLDPRNMPKMDEPELPAQSSSPDGTGNFFARGNDYLQSGKIKEAVQAYEKAVKADPSFPDAHYNLAVAYQQSGAADKSAEEFKKYKSLVGNQ